MSILTNGENVLNNTAALLFIHIDETKAVITQSLLKLDSTQALSHAKPYPKLEEPNFAW